MTASERSTHPAIAVLPDRVDVVNVGLPLFGAALADQGRPAAQVDWRIPAGADPASVAALRRLCGPLADTVDIANAEVVRRLDGGRPHLVDVVPAGRALADLGDRTLLHCGPPISYLDAIDPLQRSMRAAVVAEDWAHDVGAAHRMLAAGEIALEPANAHQVVVPMATSIGPGQPLHVVELAGGLRAHAPLVQGSGDVAWLGRDSAGAVQRLVFLREVVQPVLAEVLAASGPVDVMSIAAQAVAMGDDVHVRTQAATNLLIRHLLPFIAAARSPHRVELATFLSQNHLFFLTVAMGAARTLTRSCADVRGSSVVVGMTRNGTGFGVRLAGSGRWHLDAAPPVEHALYLPGYGTQDAAPDIGDSAVLELVGLGAAAAAGSPAVAQLLGGGMARARALTEDLDRICLARSSSISLPALGGRGTPLGVDVRLAVELEITPQITTGVLHCDDGSGQIGAGIARAPLGAFRSALLALDTELAG